MKTLMKELLENALEADLTEILGAALSHARSILRAPGPGTMYARGS